MYASDVIMEDNHELYLALKTEFYAKNLVLFNNFNYK